MELTIKHRVILLNMSAAFTGNMVALGKIQRFREALSLTTEEAHKVNFRNTEAGYQWDEPDGPIVKEVEVPERAMELIAAVLTKMNDSQVLTLDHINLYELFVGNDSDNGNHSGTEIPEKVEAG